MWNDEKYPNELWCTAPKNGSVGARLMPPYENIWIGSDPRDGIPMDLALTFDAIINVSCTPGALFYPAKPEQRTYWIPINEMGQWGYASFFAFIKIMDFHYAKGHKILVHCLPFGTEVLTETGWMPIEFVHKGRKIYTYDQQTGSLRLSKVRRGVQRNLLPDEKVYAFQSNRLKKPILVTAKHRMAFHPDMGALAEDVPESTLIKEWVWPGQGNGFNDALHDELLQLIAWIVGDGSLYTKTGISFHLKKERKISRIIELVDALSLKMKIPLTLKKHHNADGTITLWLRDPDNFFINLLGADKKYPWGLVNALSRRQASLLIHEMVQVDGDYENYKKKGAIRLNTKRQEDVDFISALISVHFGICTYRRVEKKSQFVDDHFMFYLNAIPLERTQSCKSGFHNTKVSRTESTYNGKVACVEVDDGFFLARQNGITFITGNCHAGAYRSPYMTMNWLVSRGHSAEEALKIERNEPEYPYKREPETPEETAKREADDARHFQWQVNRLLADPDNVPVGLQEFYRRLRNSKYDNESLQSLLHYPEYIEISAEVMGRKRMARHLHKMRFAWYYRAKDWLRRTKEASRDAYEGRLVIRMSNWHRISYPRERYFSWPWVDARKMSEQDREALVKYHDDRMRGRGAEKENGI